MKMKFYYCKHCGKILVIENEVDTPTICCGDTMSEMFPKTSENEDFSEKHIPQLKLSGSKVTVSVGSTLHPATKEHHIEWIILVTNKGIQQKCLGSEEKPVVDFFLAPEEKVLSAYAYCNLHKLWKADCKEKKSLSCKTEAVKKTPEETNCYTDC